MMKDGVCVGREVGLECAVRWVLVMITCYVGVDLALVLKVGWPFI